MTDEWLQMASTDLGIGPDVLDVDAVLVLARDVAHNVERKAAPLTAYLVGYAAGAAGADGPSGTELSHRLAALAREWGGGAE